MVAPTGPDGKVRHIKSISEKLVPLKKGLQQGIQLFYFSKKDYSGLLVFVVFIKYF